MAKYHLQVVANFSTARCGVRNFAEQLVTALRHHAGTRVEVRPVDATHGVEWGDLAWADQTLLCWHPGPLGHFDREATFFPDHSRFSLWIAEVPPYSRCTFQDRARLVFGADPIDSRPDATILWYPVPDWIDFADLGPIAPRATVGFSGIRGVGFDRTKALCDRHGWTFNASPVGPHGGAWLPVDDEVRRLSSSWVNVAWYDDGRQETASGPSTYLASRRPLLVNAAPMLHHLRPYLKAHAGDPSWCIYGALRTEDEVPLEDLLPWMIGHRSTLKTPELARMDLAWGKAVRKFLAVWGVA